MSDALLTRIAEALEKLVHHMAPQKQTIAGSEPTAPPAAEPAKRGRPKAQAAEPTSAPVAAATAGVISSAQTSTPQTTAQPAAAPAPTQASESLVNATANAIIELANNYSRDAAVACMAKYGAQKVSQVKPEHMAALFKDVQAAIAAEQAKKANDSLV